MEKFVIKNIRRPDSSLINQLSKLDVSTVYEAQGKQGLMSPNLRPIKQGQFTFGTAVNAVCYAGDNLMIHAAIEVCKPGDILIVSTIGDSTAGMIGELIVSALMKRGVKGLIIDAGIRDVARIREMGFPVWSKAVHSQGTTKNRGGWVNKDAIVGDTLVKPGDVIMADDDGIVVIDKNQLQETITLSKKRLDKEEKVKEKIANGEISVDFYHLRSVLEKENVKYYDTADDLKLELGVKNKI